MSRIGFSKPVLKAIEGVKSDTKIDGWKKTFIQYKSRCEKRKNWREKTKLLKELDTKFGGENENETEEGVVNLDEEVSQTKTNKIEEKIEKIQSKVLYSL